MTRAQRQAKRAVAQTAPARIWLQHDPDHTGEPFDSAYDVTWCRDKINHNDIAYVRADLAAARAKARKK